MRSHKMYRAPGSDTIKKLKRGQHTYQLHSLVRTEGLKCKALFMRKGRAIWENFPVGSLELRPGRRFSGEEKAPQEEGKTGGDSTKGGEGAERVGLVEAGKVGGAGMKEEWVNGSI